VPGGQSASATDPGCHAAQSKPVEVSLSGIEVPRNDLDREIPLRVRGDCPRGYGVGKRLVPGSRSAPETRVQRTTLVASGSPLATP
jgi:hypothetical protein